MVVIKREKIKMQTRAFTLPERAKWERGPSGGGGFVHKGNLPGRGFIGAAGRMSAYRAGVRIAGSPIRAPITYTQDFRFVPTETLKGGKAYLPLPGSPLARGVFGPIGQIVEGGARLIPGGGSRSSGFVPLPSASAAPLGGGAIAPTPTKGLGGITGITTGMTSIGSGIIDTVKQYIPLIVIGGIAILGIKMLMGK